MGAADNLMALGAGHAYSALIESGERELADARARALQSITPDDVLQELLIDHEADLRAAGEDAAAIGRVYLAARSALADRLADRFLGVDA
jgi:hypothetical protein